MSLILNKKTTKKTLSDHPNYKRKVPRLSVSNGVARIDSDDTIQKKWFEEFKK
ncbi:hypothetical protein ACH6EH_11110 [Paenibacillus sp. JSM ZJ436]|uniref:hypothetical protein n=1 Tax=Paenibacillus sp. JSM ZJ436 TaxID=3376190 RepID=UPI0037919797